MRTVLATRLEKETSTLTQQELEVLHMISFDYNIEEVACELRCSVAKAEEIRKNVYSKMEVETMAGLIRAAFEQGLLQLVEV